MTAVFELSAVVDRLAGPAGLKLSLALLHFLWQGVLIAAGAGVLMRLLGRRSPNRRYAIGVGGMALMAIAPIVTFCVVTPSSVETLEPIGAAASEEVLAEIERLETMLAVLGEGEEAHGAGNMAVAPEPPLTWRERIRLWQPYALLLWLGGTGLFALRLGVGVQASRSFGRGRRPLPEAWLKIVIDVAGTLGVKTPQVFVSDRVVEAVAVGLLRPMVLIPAAWLGRVPPEVLEAVLAHELAHLRRYDLWVNLLQRCVEAALFYHPVVWWLSRRVRMEREYCCDETAATVVSGRATYARALEFAATEAAAARRNAAVRPTVWNAALAAGIGGDSMALLDRVRRVLGGDGKPPRGSWMSEGLLALAVPAALWAGIATVGPAVAKADDAETETAEVTEDEGHDVEEPNDVLLFRDVETGEPLENLEYGLAGEDFGVVFDEETFENFGTIDDVGRRVDYLIARNPGGDLEGQGPENDLRAALRELREELKALRGEVEGLRSRKSAEVKPAYPEIQAALDKRIALRFKDAPLRDVVERLRETAGVNVVIDETGLMEEGITRDSPVSINVEDVSIKSALNLILSQFNLGYVVEDEAVKITSRQRTKGMLYVEAYVVGDLLARDGSIDDEAKRSGLFTFDGLTDLITGTIEPNSWEHVGGVGVVRKNEASKRLVVRQTRDVHDAIAKLLSMQRQRRTNDATSASAKRGSDGDGVKNDDFVVRRGKTLYRWKGDVPYPHFAEVDPAVPVPAPKPGALRLEAKIDGKDGPPRFILRKFDSKGPEPERFEARIFKHKDGGDGPGPDVFLKRLNVEEIDGKPRVFLFRDHKDGKPERIEGKLDGDETIIETKEGRIHVRRLSPDESEKHEEMRRRIKILRDEQGHLEGVVARKELDVLRREERVLEETLGENHPKRQAIRKRVEAIEKHPIGPVDGHDPRDQVIHDLRMELQRLRKELEASHIGKVGEATWVIEMMARQNAETAAKFRRRKAVEFKLEELRREEQNLKEVLSEGHPERQAIEESIRLLEKAREALGPIQRGTPFLLEELDALLKGIDLPDEKRKDLEEALIARITAARADAEAAMRQAQDAESTAQMARQAAEEFRRKAELMKQQAERAIEAAHLKAIRARRQGAEAAVRSEIFRKRATANTIVPLKEGEPAEVGITDAEQRLVKEAEQATREAISAAEQAHAAAQEAKEAAAKEAEQAEREAEEAILKAQEGEDEHAPDAADEAGQEPEQEAVVPGVFDLGRGFSFALGLIR